MKQLRSFRGEHASYVKKDARVVAIVGDKAETIRAFKEREQIPFEILRDPEGDAYRALGVARSGKVKGRPYAHPTTLVVDPEGVVRFVEVRKLLFLWRASPAKLLALMSASAVEAR